MGEPYVGEIRMVGFSFAPINWAFCNGAPLSISQYEVLYTLIGTTYGGDGTSTFNLPNLLGRTPVHTGTLSGTSTQFPLAQSAGSETVTLITNQLPAHTHVAQCNGSGPDGATSPSPTNNYWADASSMPGNVLYNSTAPDVQLNPKSISVQGGNLPHDNIAPSLCINFIISLYGIFPPQS